MCGIFFWAINTFDTITLISSDTTNFSQDFFLVKYDTNGFLLWAKKAGGTNYDNSKSIAVDTSGNVYIIGNLYYN